MMVLKGQKKKLKAKKKGRKDEQEELEGLVMPAKFLEENAKSRSPGARLKISQSKEKKPKMMSPEKPDVLSPRGKNLSKNGRI